MTRRVIWRSSSWALSGNDFYVAFYRVFRLSAYSIGCSILVGSECSADDKAMVAYANNDHEPSDKMRYYERIRDDKWKSAEDLDLEIRVPSRYADMY